MVALLAQAAGREYLLPDVGARLLLVQHGVICLDVVGRRYVLVGVWRAGGGTRRERQLARLGEEAVDVALVAVAAAEEAVAILVVSKAATAEGTALLVGTDGVGRHLLRAEVAGGFIVQARRLVAVRVGRLVRVDRVAVSVVVRMLRAFPCAFEDALRRLVGLLDAGLGRIHVLIVRNVRAVVTAVVAAGRQVLRRQCLLDQMLRRSLCLPLAQCLLIYRQVLRQVALDFRPLNDLRLEHALMVLWVLLDVRVLAQKLLVMAVLRTLHLLHSISLGVAVE